MHMKKELVKELNKLCDEPKLDTFGVNSLKDLKVTLVDYHVNPYKSMFEMALQTWGAPHKWNRTSPELRFEVVKGVLDKKALPLALEAPHFSFEIENITRAGFDQIARTRQGVVFAARGFKDNNLNYLIPTCPECMIEDAEALLSYARVCGSAKAAYSFLQEKYPNWVARYVVLMNSAYNFFMCIDFAALQKMCSNRMETTEMQDVVATAWLLREAIKTKFPLLAEYLRPNCDWKQKDTTTYVNGFADELGVIHGSDNRWPGFKSFKGQVRHKEPCSDIKLIAKECKIEIPGPKAWKNYTWETLADTDRELFMSN